MSEPATYIGRFAPSPSGHLHFGSLVAAVASYCAALKNRGHWFVRIDDIDPPREVAGSTNAILAALNAHGFDCSDVRYQSARTDSYTNALLSLNEKTKLYACECSRRELKGAAVYPGYCAPSNNSLNAQKNQQNLVLDTIQTSAPRRAIRLCVNGHIAFTDCVQGEQSVDLSSQIGDTILLRKDKLFAYALACAVDDGEQVNHVVRGNDLLMPTAIQIAIMRTLGLPTPHYAHVPVAVNQQQQKLSKQTNANAIDNIKALQNLKNAWAFLGQNVFDANTVPEFWQQAIAQWNMALVPQTPTIILATDLQA